MGTKDIETAIFFDDDRRYADLLNGYIFDGKQVIMEKQLYSQDTRETGKSQKDSWGGDTSGYQIPFTVSVME